MIESPPGLFLYLKLEDIYHNTPCTHRKNALKTVLPRTPQKDMFSPDNTMKYAPYNFQRIA
jgi:hypothetical protein